jgi:zinc protease
MTRSLVWRECSAPIVLLLAGLIGGCTLTEARPHWERPPPPAKEAPVVQPGALTRTTLDNGLRVLVLVDRRLPRVTLGLSARRGAGSVAVSHAGLAAFTAELMKRGAGDWSALALAQTVDEIGASLSVEAGWDSTGVTISGLSRDLDRLIEVLADVVLKPRFTPEEAEKAREEQLGGLAQAKDDPRRLVSWAASKALYPEHRYGLPLDGTPKSVVILDERLAREFHSNVFVPSNCVLFASGDIEPSEWLRRAEAIFGAWEGGDTPAKTPRPPAPVPATRRIVIVDRPDLVQAQIIVGHDGIRRADPVRIPAMLMNNVLGGSSFSSRMMAHIRGDEGLTYGVYSGFSLRREPGPFRVSTFTRAPEARRVVDLILAELETMREGPPSEDELAKAASYSVGRFGLGLESSSAVMTSLVNLDIYGLPEDSLDTYRSRVRAVDTEATASAARELLYPDRAAVVLLGPAAMLAPQFEDLGNVEIVQP